MKDECKNKSVDCEGIVGRMIKTNEYLCTFHYYKMIRDRSTE